MNTAVAAAVFVVSSCVVHRPSPTLSAPAPPEPSFAPFTPQPTGEPPAMQIGFATYYARSFAGRKTANGERYDPGQMTAAHRTLPFGTMVEVRRSDGRRVVVRINDRGPYGARRIIDLSHRAAEQLGMLGDGKIVVELRAAALEGAARP
ncbi:MAG TPA: septal ring lytic transglycosylase RlpA family protein [Polyangiaceae bacterium]|nr:septal ring lytic transglycosylase RlpA family protein [Polyangiaceae bacterium]